MCVRRHTHIRWRAFTHTHNSRRGVTHAHTHQRAIKHMHTYLPFIARDDIHTQQRRRAITHKRSFARLHTNTPSYVCVHTHSLFGARSHAYHRYLGIIPTHAHIKSLARIHIYTHTYWRGVTRCTQSSARVDTQAHSHTFFSAL